jgi:hypothetical protein
MMGHSQEKALPAKAQHDNLITPLKEEDKHSNNQK